MLAFSRRIKNPIIVLGAGRSGTTILAEILSVHPDVAYWSEPRPVWMYGHAYRKDHVLGRQDLTPRIARWIDARFGKFLDESGRARFMEKTPSNCLRIPFIHALYPDCRIIHIIRDGRRSVRSTVEISGRVPNKGSVATRLRETAILEWPAYVSMFFNTVWRTNVLGKPARYWGARPPGWKEFVDAPLHIAAAWQWAALVRASIEEGRKLPAENYEELRFEQLVERPVEIVCDVQRFARLPESPEVRAKARERISPKAVRRWTDTLTPEQQQEAEQVMQPLLSELGYV